MNKVKYITFVNEFGCDDIIVFSFAQKHSHIASVMVMREDILGAGFIDFTPTELPYNRVGVVPRCYGESTSLKVVAREEQDNEIANTMLQLNG